MSDDLSKALGEELQSIGAELQNMAAECGNLAAEIEHAGHQDWANRLYTIAHTHTRLAVIRPMLRASASMHSAQTLQAQKNLQALNTSTVAA